MLKGQSEKNQNVASWYPSLYLNILRGIKSHSVESPLYHFRGLKKLAKWEALKLPLMIEEI